MREELNLKISQFVDGELAAEDVFKLLKSFQDDAEVENIFRRYDAVSQAIKSDVFLVADAGFVERVSAQIKNEPTIFRPIKQPLRGHAKTITAIAASFAALAVAIAGALQSHDKQLAANVELAQHQTSKQIYVDSSPVQEDDTRFNDYLEAHGATLYGGGHASSPANGTSQPYGRFVSYGRK